MNSAKQISSRLREVFLDGTWIANINFKSALENLNWQQATQKVGSLNTIAALTFHIEYYLGGVNQVFEGGQLEIRDKFSFDCPDIKSEEEWQDLFQSFLSSAEKFSMHVEGLSEDQLNAPFVDEKYGDYRRNIEGMIEHGYYHLGQVSLIKKMILKQSSSE